jgi:tetratricopeptide (TPR) repeat protein
MRLYHLAILLVICYGLLTHIGLGQVNTMPSTSQVAYDRGQAALKIGNLPIALQLFTRAVELDPDYVEAIKALASTARTIQQRMDPGLRPSYATFLLLRNFYSARLAASPESALFQWALGMFDDSQTQVEAERCFNKAIALDPRFAEAYESLASTLVYRGDLAGARVALLKLYELSPLDSEALAAYALRVRGTNSTLFNQLMENFFLRFRGHIAGAELLSKAAAYEGDLTARITLLERLKALYPPNENEVSEWHMRFLFNAYNRTNPPQALSLAQEMTLFMPAQSEAGRDWKALAEYAQLMVMARSLMNRQSFTQVADTLGKVKPPYLISPDPQAMILAEAAEMSGDTARAYQILVRAAADQPTDALQDALLRTGSKLKKTASVIEGEIWAARIQKKSKAKDFELLSFRDGKKIRLSEFRGRVVLLRFWSPGDGASREEFLQLQKMLEKYQPQGFAIVTVNMNTQEDAIAAIIANRYGFAAQRALNTQWIYKNYKVDHLPSNFLIDREGRVLSRPEFWGIDPQHTFELEVEAALAHGQKGALR